MQMRKDFKLHSDNTVEPLRVLSRVIGLDPR